jgi:hypothetical protein
MERKDFLGLSSFEDLKGIRNLKKILEYITINGRYTSGEKLPPYLRLPEKAIAYSVAIKVSK